MLLTELLPFFLAFVIVYLTLPILIRSAHKKNILATDINKKNRPAVANLGGLILYFAIAGAILASVLLYVYLSPNYRLFTELLAALACVSILAVIGLFDDLFRISPRLKVLLPVLGALPLIAITAGDTSLSLPLIGSVDLGLLYTFVLIPVGITGAANAINMTAGYNGLEAGITAIAAFFLLVIAWHSGATASVILLAALLGSCLAFLRYNWYPARVFPADVGTLIMGATLACAVILGNMEKYGVIALLPSFFELASTVYYGIKRVARRSACHNPVILSDGRLSPPRGAERFSLAYFVLSFKPQRESRLVLTIWGLFLLSGLAALALYWLKV